MTTLSAVELRRIGLPLVGPFRTSFGIETHRDILLLKVETSEGEGWGECVASAEPLYSSEYADGAHDVLTRFLLPFIAGKGDISASDVSFLLEPFRGHRMAKGALEMALLDAELRSAGVAFSAHLGGVKSEVDSGVSVGIMDGIPQLLDAVEGYLETGYQRIKLKVEPGWDLEPVQAVRERFGDIRLQVDANTAYTLGDATHLAKLDAFDLLLIEQPLPEDDLVGHVEVARVVNTPICLDESITSAAAAVQAIGLGACSIVNIKAGRVGGYLEAKKIHDVCAERDIPVWCGGMLESGLGRAANVALASLPNFTLPGDTSASDRYYKRDITQPFVLEGGRVKVPEGPGLGVTPDMDYLDEVTTSVVRWRP